MPNLTIICYLTSLLFYGMGSSKIFDLSNAVSATSYFVFAIFFAVIGSVFFYVKNNTHRQIVTKRRKKSNLSQNLRGNQMIVEARAS